MNRFSMSKASLALVALLAVAGRIYQDLFKPAASPALVTSGSR